RGTVVQRWAASAKTTVRLPRVVVTGVTATWLGADGVDRGADDGLPGWLVEQPPSAAASTATPIRYSRRGRIAPPSGPSNSWSPGTAPRRPARRRTGCRC